MNDDKVHVVNIINGEFTEMPRKVFENPFFAKNYRLLEEHEHPEEDKVDVEDLYLEEVVVDQDKDLTIKEN